MGQEAMHRRGVFDPAGDSSDGLVAVVNAQGQIVSCTPELGSALGYAVPELVGRTVGELTRNQGRILLGPDRRIAAGFAEGPVSFFHRDGRCVPMVCQRSPYLRGTGETFAFLDCRPSGQAGAPSVVVGPSPGQQALLRARIRRALRDGEFTVYYQPLFDLAHGAMCGIEALVRWQNQSQGLVDPGGFLPFAEESGQILEIGEHVLRESCTHARTWMDRTGPSIQLGVNVSACQLAQPGFPRAVDAILRETGFPARLLELEVAEKTLAADDTGLLRTLAALREVGVTLAVDNFGTRVSAFARLRLLPLNRVKIDGSFVHGMTDTSGGPQIVAALIAMGHSLGVEVAAECVENGEQVRRLRDLGCLQGQGFYFGRAAPRASISALLGRRPSAGLPPGLLPPFSRSTPVPLPD